MSGDPRLAARLMAGGIAGFIATLPMSLVMRRLHRRLPAQERYPATPRELIDSATDVEAGEGGEGAARDLTLAAHYLYGAAAGAAIAAAMPRMGAGAGAVAGVGVWSASYLGWIPAAGLLKPATEHPPRWSGMMIAAHLVWGAATALALRELLRERETIFSGGPDRDVPVEGLVPGVGFEPTAP